MKRFAAILAAFSVSAFSSPFHVGADAGLGVTHPLIGSDFDGVDGSVGLGASIGPVAEYTITPLIGVQGGISYAYQSWSIKSSTTGNKADYSQSNLEFSLGPTLHVNKISAGLGYRWSMPLGGSIELTQDGSTASYDIQWAGSTPSDTKYDAMSTHNLYFQGGYEVIPHLTVGLDIDIGLTGLQPKVTDAGNIDGADSRSKNFVTNRYALNFRYDFL